MLLLVVAGASSSLCLRMWVVVVAHNIPQAAVSVVARLQPALPALPSRLLLLVSRYACSSSSGSTSSRSHAHLGGQQQACQQVFVAGWLLCCCCWWRHHHAPGMLQVCWLVLVGQLLHGVGSGTESSSLLLVRAGSAQQLHWVRSLALLRGSARKFPCAQVLLVCVGLAVLLCRPVRITVPPVVQHLCRMLLAVSIIVLFNCSGLKGLKQLHGGNTHTHV